MILKGHRLWNFNEKMYMITNYTTIMFATRTFFGKLVFKFFLFIFLPLSTSSNVDLDFFDLVSENLTFLNVFLKFDIRNSMTSSYVTKTFALFKKSNFVNQKSTSSTSQNTFVTNEIFRNHLWRRTFEEILIFLTKTAYRSILSETYTIVESFTCRVMTSWTEAFNIDASIYAKHLPLRLLFSISYHIKQRVFNMRYHIEKKVI